MISLTFVIVAFLAGVLTVLAPCILPLLPVVIGSSASGRSKATPYIVVASLGLSIILFTYLLKASTLFITIPAYVWTYFSGGVLLLFGLTLVFPRLWEKLPGLSKATVKSNKILGSGHKKKSFWGDVLIGAALGPVFSTCSPTYFVILAQVLPESFFVGTVYLLMYTLGLSLILLLIALLGERFASRLTGFSNPNGWFKKGLGVLFILLGIMIALGIEKKIEAVILDSGYFDITKVENRLLEKIQ
jgi:cytochrome c biogenesis protein CcdA